MSSSDSSSSVQPDPGEHNCASSRSRCRRQRDRCSGTEIIRKDWYRAVKWLVLFPPIAIFVALVLGLAVAYFEDDPEVSTSTAHGKLIPSGWEAFEFGDLSGAAPRPWTVQLVTTKEFQDAATAGLSQLPMTEEERNLVRGVDYELLGDTALVLRSPLVLPSLVLFPCVRGQGPLTPGSAQAFAESEGLNAAVVGEADYEGEMFAIVKFKVSPPVDIYVTAVGTSPCTSIVYYYAEPGDQRAVNDMREMLSYMHVGPGKIGLAEK